MKRILFLSFIFLMFSQNGFSQTILKGKIISDITVLGEVYITNLNSNEKTIVDIDGFFSIDAKPNQVLVFSGPKTDRKVLNLKPSDFSSNLLIVKLYPKTNQLEEVVIKSYPNINSVSLGIVSKNIKTYTPAERRLISGSSGIGIVQFLNAINGKTKELKKNVEIEKKERLLVQISNLYPNEFYVQDLKITSEYIKGFQLFVIDDKKVMASLKDENKILTAFLLTELAAKFNKIIHNDKT